MNLFLGFFGGKKMKPKKWVNTLFFNRYKKRISQRQRATKKTFSKKTHNCSYTATQKKNTYHTIAFFFYIYFLAVKEKFVKARFLKNKMFVFPLKLQRRRRREKVGIQGITFTTYSSSKIKYSRSVNTFCVCKIESAKKRGIFSVFSTLLLPLEKKKSSMTLGAIKMWGGD